MNAPFVIAILLATVVQAMLHPDSVKNFVLDKKKAVRPTLPSEFVSRAMQTKRLPNADLALLNLVGRSMPRLPQQRQSWLNNINLVFYNNQNYPQVDKDRIVEAIKIVERYLMHGQKNSNYVDKAPEAEPQTVDPKMTLVLWDAVANKDTETIHRILVGYFQGNNQLLTEFLKRGPCFSGLHFVLWGRNFGNETESSVMIAKASESLGHSETFRPETWMQEVTNALINYKDGMARSLVEKIFSTATRAVLEIQKSRSSAAISTPNNPYATDGHLLSTSSGNRIERQAATHMKRPMEVEMMPASDSQSTKKRQRTEMKNYAQPQTSASADEFDEEDLIAETLLDFKNHFPVHSNQNEENQNTDEDGRDSQHLISERSEIPLDSDISGDPIIQLAAEQFRQKYPHFHTNFFYWILDENINICLFCADVSKKNREYIGGHLPKLCPKNFAADGNTRICSVESASRVGREMLAQVVFESLPEKCITLLQDRYVLENSAEDLDPSECTNSPHEVLLLQGVNLAARDFRRKFPHLPFYAFYYFMDDDVRSCPCCNFVEKFKGVFVNGHKFRTCPLEDKFIPNPDAKQNIMRLAKQILSRQYIFSLKKYSYDKRMNKGEH